MKLALVLALGTAFVAALDAGQNQYSKGGDPAGTAVEQNAAGNPRTKHFRLNADGVAIDGYDPVSYFRGGPKKGSAKLAFTYNGVVYRFANAQNLADFKANPGQYEPAWGGWCGHAMAVRGEKVEINPECYKIVNGRNVLFFRTFYANALSNWEKEIKKTPENTLMKQGDDFWARIIKE